MNGVRAQIMLITIVEGHKKIPLRFSYLRYSRCIRFGFARIKCGILLKYLILSGFSTRVNFHTNLQRQNTHTKAQS